MTTAKMPCSTSGRFVFTAQRIPKNTPATRARTISTEPEFLGSPMLFTAVISKKPNRRRITGMITAKTKASTNTETALATTHVFHVTLGEFS